MPVTGDWKIRVTEEFGTDEVVGLTNPQVNMPVRHGIDDCYIISIDSDNLIHLSLTQGGAEYAMAYNHEVQILYSVAVASWGFPGASDVTFGNFKADEPTATPPDDSFTVCQGGIPTGYNYSNH